MLVPPTDDNIPGLTPRLALKRPGDRIYLGPKVAGRYTLNPVTDPNGTVVFFATGTGRSAPQRHDRGAAPQGPHGPDRLRRHGPPAGRPRLPGEEPGARAPLPNYHYLPLPTREPDVPKRYIQDLITDDVFAKEYGVELDAANTHVFMCGNPAMIGLPTENEETGELTYPKPTGVVEILTERGFTLDRRKTKGNLHYEEYW